jgi:hypothetical protein
VEGVSDADIAFTGVNTMRATDGTTRSLSIYHDRELLVRVFVVASLIAAVTTAAFLLSRRIAGAYSAELPAPQLFIVATLALAWAIAIRELSYPSAIFPSIAITVLLALAIACSYPGSRILDWLIWPAVMLEAVFLPALRRRHKPLRPTATAPLAAALDSEEPSENILQQLTRIRLADNHEAIRGELIAEFPTGERQVTLHVAFCPPFELLPHIDVNIADDSDATVKVTQFLHNGTQLEVRLPEPAEKPIRVHVELYATESPS